MTTLRAADERHLINLLAMAEGTRWTGTILGPGEGQRDVYTYAAGTLQSHYLEGTTMTQRQCPECLVWTWNDDHTCLTYDGPPCVTCGEPTLYYEVGAPGYGSGRTCAAGHRERLTPHGILTIKDVI